MKKRKGIIMSNLNLLISDVKEFLSDSVNRVWVLVLLLFIINICGLYRISGQINECHRDIHHRYFNTTRSLEQIHNVQIDTRDGSLKFNLRALTNTLDKQ